MISKNCFIINQFTEISCRDSKRIMSVSSVISIRTLTGLPSHLTQAPARYPTVIARHGIFLYSNSIPPFESSDLTEIGVEKPLNPNRALQLSSQPLSFSAKNNSSPAMNNLLQAIANDKNPSPKSGHEFLSSSSILATKPAHDFSIS